MLGGVIACLKRDSGFLAPLNASCLGCSLSSLMRIGMKWLCIYRSLGHKRSRDSYFVLESKRVGRLA